MTEDLSHFLELGRKALAELPDTADDIASYLQGLGVKAVCGHANECAIADYLIERVPLPEDTHWEVQSTWTYLDSPQEIVLLDVHSAEVREFIGRFDAERYPELMR